MINHGADFNSPVATRSFLAGLRGRRLPYDIRDLLIREFYKDRLRSLEETLQRNKFNAALLLAEENARIPYAPRLPLFSESASLRP